MKKDKFLKISNSRFYLLKNNEYPEINKIGITNQINNARLNQINKSIKSKNTSFMKIFDLDVFFVKNNIVEDFTANHFNLRNKNLVERFRNDEVLNDTIENKAIDFFKHNLINMNGKSECVITDVKLTIGIINFLEMILIINPTQEDYQNIKMNLISDNKKVYEQNKIEEFELFMVNNKELKFKLDYNNNELLLVAYNKKEEKFLNYNHIIDGQISEYFIKNVRNNFEIDSLKEFIDYSENLDVFTKKQNKKAQKNSLKKKLKEKICEEEDVAIDDVWNSFESESEKDLNDKVNRLINKNLNFLKPFIENENSIMDLFKDDSPYKEICDFDMFRVIIYWSNLETIQNYMNNIDYFDQNESYWGISTYKSLIGRLIQDTDYFEYRKKTYDIILKESVEILYYLESMGFKKSLISEEDRKFIELYENDYPIIKEFNKLCGINLKSKNKVRLMV